MIKTAATVHRLRKLAQRWERDAHRGMVATTGELRNARRLGDSRDVEILAGHLEDGHLDEARATLDEMASEPRDQALKCMTAPILKAIYHEEPS